MIQKLLPTSINSIARILNDNKILINQTIDQLTTVLNFLSEIKQPSLILSMKSRSYPLKTTE